MNTHMFFQWGQTRSTGPTQKEHHEAQKISQLANENEHLGTAPLGGTGYLVIPGTEVDGSKG